MARSRGGWTSKIHALADSNGLPVRLATTPGEAHDNRLAKKLLSRLKSASMLLADRGYDADWIRKLAIEKGAWANIPPKSNRDDPICLSPYLYRARNPNGSSIGSSNVVGSRRESTPRFSDCRKPNATAPAAAGDGTSNRLARSGVSLAQHGDESPSTV